MAQTDLKFPAAIQIMGEWVRIKYVDHIAGDDPLDYVYGDYCDHTNTIRIRKETPETMARTLLHELIHAILAKSGWAQSLGKEKEESLCRLIEHLSLIYCLKVKGGKIRWKRNCKN